MAILSKKKKKTTVAKILKKILLRDLEPVWVSFFYHSISITHHSFFHTHLATSLLFSSLNFFTLFMDPTPVSRYNLFFFFFFSVPNSPKLILLKKKKILNGQPRKRKEKKKKKKNTVPIDRCGIHE